jgi:hypothetical protein
MCGLVGLDDAKSCELHIQLRTWTPNFAYFEVRRNTRPSQRTRLGRIDWLLEPGENRLKIRSVNAGGLHGEACEVTLELTEPSPKAAYGKPRSFVAPRTLPFFRHLTRVLVQGIA